MQQTVPGSSDGQIIFSRKDAKAGQMIRARLCVFAIFASLREINALAWRRREPALF